MICLDISPCFLHAPAPAGPEPSAHAHTQTRLPHTIQCLGSRPLPCFISASSPTLLRVPSAFLFLLPISLLTAIPFFSSCLLDQTGYFRFTLIIIAVARRRSLATHIHSSFSHRRPGRNSRANPSAGSEPRRQISKLSQVDLHAK